MRVRRLPRLARFRYNSRAMTENQEPLATLTETPPMGPSSGAGPTPQSRSPRLWLLLGGALLAVYAALIWFDLPPPAGMKYVPPPAGLGQTATYWWEKTQALRGWSIYPEGWAWA